MNTSNLSIELKNVNKSFKAYKQSFLTLRQRMFNLRLTSKSSKFRALKNINVKIYRNECIGIIGRNGSGKSTLIKIMSGAIRADKGSLVTKNGNSILLNLGVGFSHELTARENIYVNGSTLGLRIKEIDELFDQIITFAELEDFVDTKIKYFSSGMIKRLSFSIAVYVKADILFLDEVFAVGDEKFRKKATVLLEESWIKDRTVVMVSHSANLINKYCSKTILMHKGEMLFFGDTETAIEKYRAIT